jgi:hypothetical protein
LKKEADTKEKREDEEGFANEEFRVDPMGNAIQLPPESCQVFRIDVEVKMVVRMN